MEYVYNVSIVCGLIKTKIFSQEIFHKERIPAGSHEENYALVLPLLILTSIYRLLLTLYVDFPDSKNIKLLVMQIVLLIFSPFCFGQSKVVGFPVI